MPEGNSYLLWQGFSAVMILSVRGIKGGDSGDTEDLNASRPHKNTQSPVAT